MQKKMAADSRRLRLLGLFLPGFVCWGGGGFIPLEILLWLWVLALPQVQAAAAARCPSELTGRPTKRIILPEGEKKPVFESSLQGLRNQFSASSSASLCSFGISSFIAQENGTDEGEHQRPVGFRLFQGEELVHLQQGEHSDQRGPRTR